MAKTVKYWPSGREAVGSTLELGGCCFYCSVPQVNTLGVTPYIAYATAP